MRLTKDIYLAGGGDYGFNLSHRLDCHVYVVDGGSELALIDAGFGVDTDRVLDNMRQDGLDPSRVTKIFITHYHADHVGGAAPMKRATGAALYAPQEVADAISTADADQNGLNWAKNFGFYPAD
jgi:glyoxylase-like metal-dependent hydrolase (beta-lactamase superfamily II)